MNESEESKSFKVQLMEYWSSKNMSNIKIPQIGGRELDFFKLYKAVIKRGGAQAVSNNKMWKEIVNEFGFPSTCTSASFTLRNHYTRFLLGYEQKYFFHKGDEEAMPVLKAGRKRKRKENSSNQPGDSSETGSDSEEVKDQTEKKVKPSQPNNLAISQQPNKDDVKILNQQFVRPNQLKQNPYPVMRMEPPKQEQNKSTLYKQLSEAYQLNQINTRQELFFTRKNKMFPMVQDIKRISLAFESRIQDEITFALNQLLLYSVNSMHQFTLESYNHLLEGIVQYLEEIIKNVPSLNKILQLKEIKPRTLQEFGGTSDYSYSGPPATKEAFKELCILDNYNFPICDIVLFNSQKKKEVSPIVFLRKRKRYNVENLKEMAGEVYLLEQTRTIFLILRNFSFTKSNEVYMAKNERLLQIMIQLFILNSDSQITKYILDILANISKQIQLMNIPDYKLFCERLFELLNADTSDELEACVDIIRNLIAIQENESIIENFLPKYIDQVTRLMLQAQGDIREGILEFLCFLSDLRMATRVQLARHPKLIMRMVGLLSSGVMKQNRQLPSHLQSQQHNQQGEGERNSEKITKLAALTLSNISLAPLSRAYLKPFERDLFVVASTDETVTKYISNILSELMNYEPESDPERQYMFQSINMANI
ncbi:hypothetical protein ABPG72_018329 [Tetrahymena utriculariae]